MNVVKISKEHINIKFEEYIDFFEELESDFSLDNDLFNYLYDIDLDNRILVCYIIILILKGNTLTPKINTPKKGLEFKNKGKSSRLDIYHAHLNNEMVLIWYLEKKGNDELFLKIIYLKHPNSYKNILINIYNSEFGFSIKYNDYFKNLKENTYLFITENRYVLGFKMFVEKYINKRLF